MLIDWYTTGAQILNFLTLVLLLRHFLYRRIIGAMDRRESALEEKAREVENERERARTEADGYKEKIQTFEEEYQHRLKDAEKDIADFRARRIREARAELSSLREQWSESLGRQQADFISQLKKRSAEEMCTMVGRALDDLADSRLEQQMIGVFITGLRADAERRTELETALGDSHGPITVTSSFPLPADQQRELIRELQSIVPGPREILFEENPQQSCGITLQGNSHLVEWNFEAYVDDFSQLFREAVAGEIRGSRLGAELDDGDGEGGRSREAEREPKEAAHD